VDEADIPAAAVGIAAGVVSLLLNRVEVSSAGTLAKAAPVLVARMQSREIGRDKKGGVMR